MDAPAIKVALFDMDGVIFEGANFWLDLHYAYGTQDEALELAAQFMKTDYQELAERTVRTLWRGRSVEPFWALVEGRPYTEGVGPLFKYLRSHGIKSAIISSGPVQLAKRAQTELGIDLIRANEVMFRDEKIGEDVQIHVSDNDKISVGLETIQTLDGLPSQTMFVGDSESDVALARAVGLSVAYNSRSKELDALATVVLKHGELEKLIEVVHRWTKN